MNENPLLNKKLEKRTKIIWKEGKLDSVTVDTIFELIRDIKDPEHPHTLEELDVVRKEWIKIGVINSEEEEVNIGLPIDYITVEFKPTIPHCSMAGIIGLALKSFICECISGYVVNIRILEESHVNYQGINRQLDDRDRVYAALENESLISVLEECIPKIK